MRGLARGLRWWSVAWLVVAGSAPLTAQETAGRIDGTVADSTGAPVAGAQVTVVGTSFRALSGVHGAFSIDHVAAVYIDGALISRAGLGTNAIEQAAVTTGAVGVEAGDAQSGLISFVTPAGGRQWRAALRYRTDDVGFDAWRNVGLHRVEASVGGPVRDNLSFFTAVIVNGQMSLESGEDRDVQ